MVVQRVVPAFVFDASFADTIVISKPRAGPTALIAGAQKAGTTTLFFLLDEHPDVFTPTVKEPGYLAFARGRQTWTGPGSARFASSQIFDRSDYEALFSPGARFPHRLEASTLYMSEPGVPEAIASFDSRIRVVFVLRDPTDRAYSGFNHMRQRRLEPLPSILDAVAAERDRANAGWIPTFGYVRLSRYGDHLRRFYATLPAEQILLVRYDELASEPLKTLRRVEGFLGLRRFDGYTLGGRHNPSGAPRFRAVQELFDYQAPRLRGRLRKILPSPVHRAILAARQRNLAQPPEMSESDRHALCERLAPQVRALRDLTGDDALVAGWCGSRAPTVAG